VFLYLIILGILFWLAVIFLRSAKGFAAFTRSGHPIDLETGVRAQKSGWIIIGVLYIIMLVFVLIAFIAILGMGGRGMF
jgi:hypothetical protein